MKQIFFNSSMPRSGSTLLQNILGNHPEIYATPTNAVFDYIVAAKKVYSSSPVVKAQDSEQMKSAFLNYCRYGLHGYFDALTEKPYVIDKSRAWAVNKPFLDSFYPNPKVICMVRDLRDIVASMEKNYRKHPDKFTFATKDKDNSIVGKTISERVSNWMLPDARPVGNTLNNLNEVFFRNYSKDILFVRFEDLTKVPQQVMDIVHNYLGVSEHKYDFDNIKQVTFEDDKFHGIYGDHKIKPQVTPVKSQAKELLGEMICDQLYEKNKWYFESFKYKK